MEPSIAQELVAKAIKGDEHAFCVLIEAHYLLIYKTAFKWCGNQTDAEDIAQNVCIKVGRSLKTFRGDSLFSTWLIRIVLNCVTDFHRKAKSKAKNFTPIDTIKDMPSPATDGPDIQAEYHQLWRLVHKLTDKQRDAVLLVYSQGYTHGEVANIMECSESTVSWHIHEAKKKLKKLMNENER